MPASKRLAVLIDADNTSASSLSALLEELTKYGVPTVKRAYGDWTTQQLAPWKDELHRHAVQPVQQFAYTTGKNSTDSALIIDAMDLLYSGNLDGFALVSSDSDFTRLATRLRESGKTVIGFGRRRTPASLVAACDRFIYLEVLSDQAMGNQGTGNGERPAAASTEDEAAIPLPDLRRIVEVAINSTSQDDGWATLSAVGSHISTNHSAFDPRNYGFPKLVELARAQNYVDVEQAPGAPVRVRLRSARPPRNGSQKKTTAKKAVTKKAASKKAAPKKTAPKKAAAERGQAPANG